MRKFLIVALVLLVGIAFSTMAFAQEKPKAAPDKPAAVAEKPAKADKEGAVADKASKQKAKNKAADKGIFSGAVTKVNTEIQTLTVKGKRGSVTFDVSRPTFKGYKTLGDVKSGDGVGVQYMKDGTKVTKLRVKKPKAKTLKAEAAKTEKPKSQKE